MKDTCNEACTIKGPFKRGCHPCMQLLEVHSSQITCITDKKAEHVSAGALGGGAAGHAGRAGR